MDFLVRTLLNSVKLHEMPVQQENLRTEAFSVKPKPTVQMQKIEECQQQISPGEAVDVLRNIE